MHVNKGICCQASGSLVSLAVLSVGGAGQFQVLLMGLLVTATTTPNPNNDFRVGHSSTFCPEIGQKSPVFCRAYSPPLQEEMLDHIRETSSGITTFECLD